MATSEWGCFSWPEASPSPRPASPSASLYLSPECFPPASVVCRHQAIVESQTPCGSPKALVDVSQALEQREVEYRDILKKLDQQEMLVDSILRQRRLAAELDSDCISSLARSPCLPQCLPPCLPSPEAAPGKQRCPRERKPHRPKVVEKVVEKIVHVPVPFDRTVPVEKIVERIVEVPVEKIIEKFVEVPFERTVPVEMIIEKIVKTEVPPVSPSKAPSVEPDPQFDPKLEYEEDLGPTLEVNMFGKVAIVAFVLLCGSLTSRLSFKALLATACVRHAVGFPIAGNLLEENSLPSLTNCTMSLPCGASYARVLGVMQQCLRSPSDVVEALKDCEVYRIFRFDTFFTLLPFVVFWIPLVGLAVLVQCHDIPLLGSRRAHIPAWLHVSIVPLTIVVSLYYIAEPLTQIVLFFRLFSNAQGSLATEVGINLIPRILFVVLFWGFLLEIIAKLCFSSATLSLFYLAPLYFTYPKMAVVPTGVLEPGQPVDPQFLENQNRFPFMVIWATVSMAVIFGVAVVVASVWIPVPFLQLF